MTLIKGSTYDIGSSVTHRAKRGGRNKYSKGQALYTRSVGKIQTDTIPEDYVQEEPPANTSLGDALAKALAQQQ